jgi:hypothetical protein
MEPVCLIPVILRKEIRGSGFTSICPESGSSDSGQMEGASRNSIRNLEWPKNKLLQKLKHMLVAENTIIIILMIYS